ncbi:hypothetical protein F0L68_09045 [Solihabitans fulvus]|uniref:DoxX-like family protein n=1 Tax=Solihabitans fulvus TaxID=1892852 RepID=A0A5B2XLJ1_9PSEU|nr:hypothetical protein [Solihabitans fulvus]KAA2263810.1 hypothetical protein F0L68_09045 [Solihabitans fulvus]
MEPNRSRSRSAAGLALLLGAGGVLHFAIPKAYDRVIPRALPGRPRAWTYASGLAELGCAAAIAVPRTRRLGGLLAAWLFAAIFPANVKMALDSRNKPLKHRLITYGRLPLQWPLITWALRVRKTA